MNALIRALEERGLAVEATRPLTYEERCQGGEIKACDKGTWILVSGERIEFGIAEKCSVVRSVAPNPPMALKGAGLESWIWQHQPRTRQVPNGTLELRIKSGNFLGVRTLWRDRKRKRIEDHLGDFIVRLHLVAEAMKRQREELERARHQREEDEGRRREVERQEREEACRTRQFEEEIGRWRLARDVREYVAEIRTIMAAASGAVADGRQLLESLKSAEALAERIDPMTRIRELLADRPAGQSAAGQVRIWTSSRTMSST
jgi:hypothetical protein